jgi:hypothetical protein
MLVYGGRAVKWARREGLTMRALVATLVLVALSALPAQAGPTTAILVDVEPYICSVDWQRNRAEWRSPTPIVMDRLLLYTEALYPGAIAGVAVWRHPSPSGNGRFMGFFSPPLNQGPGQVTIELGGIPLLPTEWLEVSWWCMAPAHPLNVFAVLYYRE